MSSENSPPARRPLEGRRVLLTRPAGASASLVERLVALGARVAARPTIALVRPADPAPARRAVSELDDYDWLIFTSANGVRFFAEALGADRPAARIAAIGPATARELERHGLDPTVTARESRSEGLAAALEGKVREGERALLVRPEQARELVPQTLRGLGVSVDAVPFYRNVAAEEAAEVAGEVCAGSYDVVLFTSPSTFKRLVESAPSKAEIVTALDGVAVVAIGEVTAGALRDAGIGVDAVAARPTDDGITQAVLDVAGG